MTAELCPTCGIWWRGAEHSCRLPYSATSAGGYVSATGPLTFPDAERLIGQCPGCFSVHSVPPEMDWECDCGEAVTILDLRKPKEADPFGAHVPVAATVTGKDYQQIECSCGWLGGGLDDAECGVAILRHCITASVPPKADYIVADTDEQGIIIDALAGHRDASERRAMVNGSQASADRAEICAELIRRIVGEP